MAEKVFTIDRTGARMASLAENREALDERQRAALGADLVDSQQTPQAQWSGIGAAVLTEVGEEGVRAAVWGSSVDDAKGTHLDSHGTLLDIRRRVATHSRVTAILTGVAGVGVTAGSRARTSTDGDEFETVADVVLSPEGVTVDLQAVETGPITAPEGTLTEIVTVIAGWETITNPSAASVGIARQSDEDYLAAYQRRTAHSSTGPLDGIEGALEEALAGRQRVVENTRNTDRIIQEWTVGAHALLVFSEGGSDGDVIRAIENHRGMGVGTMTAIRGGAPNATALGRINNGTINWNGTDYTGLDLSSDTTDAARAASLTALLAADDIPPTIAVIAGRFVAQYRWAPGETPRFALAASDDAAAAFGFDPDDSTAPAGPFLRPREQALVVSFTLTRQTGFPADGVSRVRQAVLAQIEAYSIGQELWANDVLCAAEAIAGTRVTSLSIQADGANVSGVAVPLDQLWTLDTGDLTITVA